MQSTDCLASWLPTTQVVWFTAGHAAVAPGGPVSMLPATIEAVMTLSWLWCVQPDSHLAAGLFGRFIPWLVVMATGSQRSSRKAASAARRALSTLWDDVPAWTATLLLVWQPLLQLVSRLAWF